MASPTEDPTAPAAAAATDAPPKESAATAGHADGERSMPADAFRDLRTRLAEMAEYASYYVSARLDAYKATARKVGILAAIGVVGLLALSSFVVTTIILLCIGFAGMLTAAFG